MKLDPALPFVHRSAHIIMCKIPATVTVNEVAYEYCHGFRSFEHTGVKSLCTISRVALYNVHTAELFPGRVDPRVGSCGVGLGRVRNMDKNGGSGRVQTLAGRVGSGPSTLTRPDPPCFSKPVIVNFDSDTQSTLCQLFPIIHRNLHHP